MYSIHLLYTCIFFFFYLCLICELKKFIYSILISIFPNFILCYLFYISFLHETNKIIFLYIYFFLFSSIILYLIINESCHNDQWSYRDLAIVSLSIIILYLVTNESYRNIITNELMTNKHQNYISCRYWGSIAMLLERSSFKVDKQQRTRREIRNVNNLRTQYPKVSKFFLSFLFISYITFRWIFFKFMLSCELFCSMFVSVWLKESILKLETTEKTNVIIFYVISIFKFCLGYPLIIFLYRIIRYEFYNI